MTAADDATGGLRVREATPADAATVGLHRARMFRDMGQVPDDAAERVLAAATAEYVADAIVRGGYRGWLAELVDVPGHVVGGAGVQVREIVPRPGPGGAVLCRPQALVINVYTEPAWRRRGVAERVMQVVLAWADGADVSSVVLHASDAGRGLYERLGFRPTNEMRFHGAPIVLARSSQAVPTS